MRFYLFCSLLFFLAILFNHSIIPSKQPVYAANCDQPWLDPGQCHAWCTRGVQGKITKGATAGGTGVSGVGIQVLSTSRCEKNPDDIRYRTKCNNTVAIHSPDSNPTPPSDYGCNSVTTNDNGEYSVPAAYSDSYAVRIVSVPSGLQSYGTTRPGWSWNLCTQSNTPNGSASYECQTSDAGCSGPDGDSTYPNKCSFQVDVPTTGTLSADADPKIINISQSVDFSATAATAGTKNSALYVVKTDGARISSCPSNVWAGNNCRLMTSLSSAYSHTWTPPAVGDYYVFIGVDDTTYDKHCSGNPTVILPNTYGGIYFTKCHPDRNDYVTVNVQTPPSPPSITSLKMDNASSNQTSVSGIYGIRPVIGRQATQDGAGWLNPMKLTVNASQGSGTITKRYVAFYDKKGGGVNPQSAYTSSATFLSDITTLLNDNRRTGFLLAYGTGIKTGDTGNNWYVWDPGITGNDKWVRIEPGSLAPFREICSTGTAPCSDSTRLYRIFTGTVENSSAPNTWRVLIDKNLGSKEMYTAVYVVDNNNLSAFSSDITPTQ